MAQISEDHDLLLFSYVSLHRSMGSLGLQSIENQFTVGKTM